MLGVVVVWTTNLIATAEFSAGMRFLSLQKRHATPQITLVYREAYRYDWAWLPPALVWAAWIIRKRSCSMLAVACYVAVFVNFSVLWGLLTFLALYAENQLFYIL